MGLIGCQAGVDAVEANRRVPHASDLSGTDLPHGSGDSDLGPRPHHDLSLPADAGAMGGSGGGGSGGGGSGGAGGGGSGGSGGGGSGGSGVTLFPATALWNLDITATAKDAQSDAAIAAIQSKGGWGAGKMQIDFSPVVLHADASTQTRTFTKSSDFFSPDCDFTAIPVPTSGAIEGSTGYSCDGGDCHLLVIDDAHKKLYEMWRANISGTSFSGGCLAVWDLTKDYVAHGRGEGCTSADAGGMPMTALVFTPDEVAAGHIDHAIRFILPNDRIGKGAYVHPATHSTFADQSSTAANAPPYGARLRLRADYPVDSLPNAGAKVVARAMQRYGMILSDGGNIALVAASDQFMHHKWSGLLGASDLNALKVTDFVMVDSGKRISYGTSTDCVRSSD